jgi:protein TonB
METKKSIELITLEVLGSLDSEDRISLQLLKETDENFPWKVLAEFQNLSAMIPSVLQSTEGPSSLVKDRLILKLNNSIDSANSHDKSAKDYTNKNDQVTSTEHLEAVLTKNKIDWGSLAVSNSTSKPASGYEEVKPKVPAIKKETSQHTRLIDNEEEIEIKDEVVQIGRHANKNESPSKLKKYIVAAVILFIISLTLFGYIFLFNRSETQETIAENKPGNIDTTAPIEELVYDNVPNVENIQQAANITPVEIQNQTESKTDIKSNSNDILPKAPPKLPDQMEIPLTETKQISSTLAEEEREEISTPDTKEEVIEESKEPTYFVAVEEMPQPIGGIQGIQRLIEYPEIAKRAGIQGKVYVKAFVDENGNVTSAEVVKGIGGGCDEAALDAIFKTKFTPGKQRGKPVKVQVTVAVLFQL